MLQNKEPMHHAGLILPCGSSARLLHGNNLFLDEPAIWSLGHNHFSLCHPCKKKEVEALSYNLWRLVRFLTRSLMCLKPGQYRSTDSRSGIIS